MQMQQEPVAINSRRVITEMLFLAAQMLVLGIGVAVAVSVPVIIWALFSEEIRALTTALTAHGARVAVIDGSQTRGRMETVEAFQNGEYDALIIQIQINTGFTLTAAATVIYHSKDWSLINRLQSEDRAHRIGQNKSVLYIDIVARDTVDKNITLALQRKESISSAVVDRFRHR